MFQNKLPARFDPAAIRGATLRRRKEGSKGKTIPADSDVSRKGISVEIPRLAFDDEEEKLDDLLQRVNSKIEKLIDSVPQEWSTPESFSQEQSAPSNPLIKPETSELDLPSPPASSRPSLNGRMAPCVEHCQISQFPSDKANKLAMEIEDRMFELQLLLEQSKSDSEPDPENSPTQTIDAELRLGRNVIQLQNEKLKVENAHLQRENKSLKEQLAVAKTRKAVAEVTTQTTSTSETCQQRTPARTTPLTTPQAKIGSRRTSPSAKELESHSPTPKATEVSPPLSCPPTLRTTVRVTVRPPLMSPATPRTKVRGRSRSGGPELESTDSQTGTPTPFPDKQFLRMPLSLPASPSPHCRSLASHSPTPLGAWNESLISSVVQSEAHKFEEYVQYHAEPMDGGWREFYQPRSMQISNRRSIGRTMHVHRTLHEGVKGIIRNLAQFGDDGSTKPDQG